MSQSIVILDEGLKMEALANTACCVPSSGKA
jgi:hypothetical protein